jgi:hypothetical protein
MLLTEVSEDDLLNMVEAKEKLKEEVKKDRRAATSNRSNKRRTGKGRA